VLLARAICALLGFSSEQPQWSEFRHVTDVGIASELCERHLHRQLTSVEVEALSCRLATLLEVALVDKNPRVYQIPGSEEILSILGKSFEFAVALATGGLRVSAELKLRSANLLNPFIPLASSNDAVSREEIIRIAARRAAEKHATQFAKFTYVGEWRMGRQGSARLELEVHRNWLGRAGGSLTSSWGRDGHTGLPSG
jgi:hypothetical protein